MKLNKIKELIKMIKKIFSSFVIEGDYRARLKFAFYKKLDDGNIVLFDRYISIEKKIYPKQNLHSSIQTPDKPFWVEVYTMEFSDVGIVSNESVLKYHLKEFLKNNN